MNLCFGRRSLSYRPAFTMVVIKAVSDLIPIYPHLEKQGKTSRTFF